MTRLLRKKSRGVIGVESAIVLIAFVIVAGALAFVYMNMGFSTTQQAKAAIGASLLEASSSLEIAGSVTGIGHVSANALNATTVPLKIANGGESVNLDPNSSSIRYFSSVIAYDNIYVDILKTGNFNGTEAALQRAEDDLLISQSPMNGLGWPDKSTAFIWFARNNNDNSIIEAGELAMLTIVWSENERPESLDTIGTEIILPTGATLSVDRRVPSVTNPIVDMG